MSPGYLRRSIFVAELTTGEITTPDGTVSEPSPRNARVLVRLHHHPIGTIDVDGVAVAPTIERIREIAFNALGDAIVEHLRADGWAAPTTPSDLADVPVDACAFDLARAASEEPLVTVAVATMTNEVACARSVQRVLDGSYPNVEIIVVDNAPDIGQTRAVIEARFGEQLTSAQVRYVAEPRRGLSRARNAGLHAARGEITVFIDDVIVDRHWLRAIVHTFDEHPEVACVTGPIAAAELESPAQALLEQYGGFNKGSRRQVFDMGENKRDTPLYPFDAGRFGSGANIALRTNTARELGGFAVDLGAGTASHGGEDIDILRRVVTSGHTLVYEPAALMWHFHRRSYRALEKQMFRYGVGFSATVTKWLLEGTDTFFAVTHRLPAGFTHVLNPTSDKNKRKTSVYPRMLTILERIGIVLGPICYLRARLAAGRSGR